MRYMLDTNICIYIMKHHPPQVRQRLEQVAIGEVVISGIVLAELRFGIHKSLHRERNEQALADFLDFCLILDWPYEAADRYGLLRAQLQRQGTPIGGHDLLIAAHALHLGTTLVTNNTTEFERIPDLRVENWAAA